MATSSYGVDNPQFIFVRLTSNDLGNVTSNGQASFNRIVHRITILLNQARRISIGPKHWERYVGPFSIAGGAAKCGDVHISDP